MYWSTELSRHDPGFGRLVSWDVDLLRGYRWASPPGQSFYRRIRWSLRGLRQLAPDVVIAFGWASPVTRLAVLYAVCSRTPLLLYGDSSTRGSADPAQPGLRTLLIRVLFRLAAGAISTGPPNVGYYRHYGMSPDRIHAGVLPTDVGAFSAARRRRATPAPDDAAEPAYIVFAGKLVERKAPDDLLRALAELDGELSWTAALIGDGTLSDAVQDLAAELGLASRVTFHGFANTSTMPDLLATADIFVLPSRQEPRGLVAVEAAAAGAAVIVSDATGVWGGPDDLIEHDVSGLVYRAGRPAELAGQLTRLLEDRALMRRLSAEGARRSEWFGPHQYAETTAAAVLATRERRRTWRYRRK